MKLPKDIVTEVQKAKGGVHPNLQVYKVVTLGALHRIIEKTVRDCATELQAIAKTAEMNDTPGMLAYGRAADFILGRYELDER